jgi:hypothetical protein
MGPSSISKITLLSVAGSLSLYSGMVCSAHNIPCVHVSVHAFGKASLQTANPKSQPNRLCAPQRDPHREAHAPVHYRPTDFLVLEHTLKNTFRSFSAQKHNAKRNTLVHGPHASGESAWLIYRKQFLSICHRQFSLHLIHELLLLGRSHC